MEIATTALNSLTLKAQEQTEQIVRAVEEQYTHLIDIIRVRKRRLELKALMNKAKNYAQWKQYAIEYDHLKSKPASDFVLLFCFAFV